MKKDPSIYLSDILECSTLIEKRMKNITYERFIEDIDLQDMVIHRLEIIGEAVRKLPSEFRLQYPGINWDDPARMRSMLIHGYDEVDIDVVWDTIENDLPKFKEQVKAILPVHK